MLAGFGMHYLASVWAPSPEPDQVFRSGQSVSVTRTNRELRTVTVRSLQRTERAGVKCAATSPEAGTRPDYHGGGGWDVHTDWRSLGTIEVDRPGELTLTCTGPKDLEFGVTKPESALLAPLSLVAGLLGAAFLTVSLIAGLIGRKRA